MLPMTCSRYRTVFTLSLWSTLCYCFISTYSHFQGSFAAFPLNQASMRPQDGAAAPKLFSNDRGTVLIIKFARRHPSPKRED